MDTKFGFPKIDRELKKSFKKNILQSVIFLIAFDSVEDIISKGEELGEILKGKYSFVQKIRRIVEQKKEEEPNSLGNLEEKIVGFQYTNEEGLELQIQEDRLSFLVQGVTYKTYCQFIEKHKKLINQILNEIGVNELKRISIRKINVTNITLSNEEIDPIEYLPKGLNVALISNFFSIPQKDRLVNCGSDLAFVNEDYRLNLSYSMITKPNKILNISLDIDSIYIPSNNLNREKLFEVARVLNDEIFNVFMWSIGTDLRLFLL